MSSSEPLPARLDPTAIEGPIYDAWEKNGYFRVEPSAVLEDGKDPYVIVIPPPNVTAVLHMGHGLNNTIQDVLIRWRRMQGRASLWVPGTDHAGIATQNVVERRLAKDPGVTRFDLGREKFVEEVWKFVDETGGGILKQLRAIGSSCDWERTRFTLDEGLSRAVREVFVQLYERDLIYRGEYIINWCPRCLTALSNEEAQGEEEEGRLHHLRFPLAESAWEGAQAAQNAGAEAVGQSSDGRWYLTVSTTRPETMLGDLAVAVHPDDKRYHALVGADVELPLVGRSIPVIADEHVDPEFGTGMVKVTPAHDPNDFDMAMRAGITPLNILTPEAAMNDAAPAPFRGMDRFVARTAVVEALKALDLHMGDEAHKHTVPHCYRCGTVVEPRLSLQWFVKMKPLAEPALAASKDGTITFTPSRWTKVYESWLENIRDWCISRQLWWGHRIPVWYCQECSETHVLREDPDACPSCGSASLEQDPDVLDTWFSSWLWPFSVFGWPEEGPELKAFYPGHTLCTAPEILFFWVSRMIMSGYAFRGEAPFTQVYLHGTVRDKHGRKMSKSLNNGIDPLEVVDRFGADALRFTMVSSAAVGTDIYLDHEDIDASFAPGRNFANKVWNAGRFTLMNLGDGPVDSLAAVEDRLELPDRWILSRLTDTVDNVSDELERFRLKEVADLVYHFFWGDFADWYLELVKPRLTDGADPARKAVARATLLHVLERTCRLLHPLIPFVTEELWSKLPTPTGEERPPALIVAPWPDGDPSHRSPDAEAALAALQETVTEVRRLRKEYGVKEGQKVDLKLVGAPPALEAALESEQAAVSRLAWIGAVESVPSARGLGAGASAVLTNGTELFVPLEGVIDLDQERRRLGTEIERLEGQITLAKKKLGNPSFTERAPAEVVEKERAKEVRYADQIAKLNETLQGLADA